MSSFTWSSEALATANTAMDGTGPMAWVVQCPRDVPSWLVWQVQCKALGTNVLSVARVFINNGDDNSNAANNRLIDEIDLPATTASATASTAIQIWEARLWLPSGFRLGLTIGTTVSAGYAVSAIGGPDYEKLIV